MGIASIALLFQLFLISESYTTRQKIEGGSFELPSNNVLIILWISSFPYEYICL